MRSDLTIRGNDRQQNALWPWKPATKPTVAQRFAQDGEGYRRSLLVFYLQAPPRTGDRGNDFRTVPGALPPHYNPILDTLIRDVRGRMMIVRSLLEETEPPPIDFIGAVTMRTPA